MLMLRFERFISRGLPPVMYGNVACTFLLYKLPYSIVIDFRETPMNIKYEPIPNIYELIHLTSFQSYSGIAMRAISGGSR